MDKWMKFVKDIKYDLLIPPLGLECSKMTPKQAKENFNWFISKIPERMEYFRKRCSSDMNIDIEKLDFSTQSFLHVWTWFLKTAQVEKTPKNEVEKMKVKYAQFGDTWIEYERFSVATEYILRDIAMYLGQAFLHLGDFITWSYVTKPKNLIHVNSPILVGFVDNRYDPPFRPQFDPIGAVRGQALKLLSKEVKETDLLDIFTKWTEYIPRS